MLVLFCFFQDLSLKSSVQRHSKIWPDAKSLASWCFQSKAFQICVLIKNQIPCWAIWPLCKSSFKALRNLRFRAEYCSFCTVRVHWSRVNHMYFRVHLLRDVVNTNQYKRSYYTQAYLGSGVSIIFKIRVFYKALFEGFEFFIVWFMQFFIKCRSFSIKVHILCIYEG